MCLNQLKPARNRHKLLGPRWMWAVDFANNMPSLQFRVPSVFWKQDSVKVVLGMLEGYSAAKCLTATFFCKDGSTPLSYSFTGAHHLPWSSQFRKRHLRFSWTDQNCIYGFGVNVESVRIRQESPLKEDCDSWCFVGSQGSIVMTCDAWVRRKSCTNYSKFATSIDNNHWWIKDQKTKPIWSKDLYH